MKSQQFLNMGKREVLSMYRHGIGLLIAATVLFCMLATSEGIETASPKISLDIYCSNLTSEGYSYSSKPRLDKYQRICRDVDGYIKCILKNRDLRIATLPFDVQPFERFFPNEYELSRATYILCTQNLIELQNTFSEDPLNCETQCDPSVCMANFATGKEMGELEDESNAVPMNLDVIRNLSCKIAAPLTNCIEMQYVSCTSKYETLKDYELGKFGGECLASQNLHSSYVTEIVCHSSTTKHYSHQRAIMKMLAVPVFWFLTNM